MSQSPNQTDELLRHAPWVRRLAVALAGPGERAAELEQELWRAALEGGPIQPRATKAWLRSTAQNLLRFRHRGDARRAERERVAAQRAGPTHAAPTDELVARAEMHRKLLDAVDRLPASLREAVLLRWFEELSPRAIAALTGGPIATVHTRLQRAKERLRRELDQDFGSRAAWAALAAPMGTPLAATSHASGAPAGTTTATASTTALLLMASKKTAVAVTALLAIPAIWLLCGTAQPTPALSDQAVSAEKWIDPDPMPSEQPGSPEMASAEVEPQREEAPTTSPGLPRRIPPGMGLVVDLEGEPLAGVEVLYVMPARFEADVAAGEARADELRAFSNANGLFALPAAPRPSLFPRLLGYEPMRNYIRLNRKGSPVVLHMMRLLEVPLTVTVTDRNTGAPVTRFKLWATTQWMGGDRAAGVLLHRTHSSPDGELVLEGRYEGPASFVEGQPSLIRIDCPGLGFGSDAEDPEQKALWAAINRNINRQVFPAPGEPLHVHFDVDLGRAERMATQGVAEGTVLDGQTGRPVAGAQVAMLAVGEESPIRAVATDTQGAFRIARPLKASPQALRLTHPDYDTVQLPVSTAAMRIELLPRGGLLVQVVDQNGQPLPGAPCNVTQLGDGFQHAEAVDEQGQLNLTGLESGRYQVFVLRHLLDSEFDSIARQSFEVSPGDTAVARVSVDTSNPVDLTGRILEPEGVVIAGAKPWFMPESNGGSAVMGELSEGGYTATGLQPGPYTVVFTRPEKRRDIPFALLRGVPVAPGQTTLDLRAPTGRITGRLLCQDPTAYRVFANPMLTDGSVAAVFLGNRSSRRMLAVEPAADGTFAIGHLMDGRWRLEILRGSSTVATRELQLRNTADAGDWKVPGSTPANR